MAHLKKLRWLLLLPLLALIGCEEERIDNLLIEDIWKETVKVTELPVNTPIPEIIFLKEDFYYQLLRRNCDQYEGRKKDRCERKRQDIEERATAIIGKPAGNLYREYLEYNYQILQEDCGRYEEKKDRKQCKRDKNQILYSEQGILGRAFFGKYRAEIYIKEILDNLYKWKNYYERNYSSISEAGGRVFVYGTVAHEMLHLAFFRRGIPGNQHHQLMKTSGNLENLLDFLSLKLGANKNGHHKELQMKSLESGIENDKIYDRIYQRMSTGKKSDE